MIFVKELMDKAIKCAIEGALKWEKNRDASTAIIKSVEVDWEWKHMVIRIEFPGADDSFETVGINIYEQDDENFHLELVSHEAREWVELDTDATFDFVEYYLVRNLTPQGEYIIQEHIKYGALNGLAFSKFTGKYDRTFIYVYFFALDSVRKAKRNFERTLSTYESIKENPSSGAHHIDKEKDVLPF